ncbi:YheC/YheD family protein [Paenibacillus sp. Marseille-Q4541]|uniref:YheC/YheD family endospore coat-associated protein n=1 Tax=Paenibacillus sp. Marseille-Q4541 TaxID=2831522 RepID=UPI001BA7E00E|nr:YheC/YheD family protein [Paenibacillus sp. Marseille-Q4541]
MNSDGRDMKPVIAILTMQDKKLCFRGNRNNFRDIIKTGEELGCSVYIVTVRDLKLSAKEIKGYRYDDYTKEWIEGLFPLPHVVYNRIPQREDEEDPIVQKKIQECLNHPDVTLFNPFFFNKWDLFEWLNKVKSTRDFIPYTKRLRTSRGLGRILEKYPYVYLKPESGKAGKGIMKLTFHKDDKLPFRLRIQDEKKSVTYKAATLQKLWNKIKLETENSNYIVQQGIELATYKGRPFDLRVLVQKNSKGVWSLSGIGARLAGHKSITTHVPRGGSVEDPVELLTEVFGAEVADRIMVQVKETVMVIAKQVEKAAGHKLGEMSMDLGVDPSGGICFFEANAKPMKFDEPGIRKRSLERIIHYCTYLAKQMEKSRQ